MHKFILFKNIYFFGCAGSYLQHVASLIFVASFAIFCCGMWDLIPWPGVESGHWDHRVLAIGSPGKSLFFKKKIIYLFLATAFVRVKDWERPKCPLIGDQLAIL